MDCHLPSGPLATGICDNFHSCQGLTLDCTILNLCTYFFAHGQLFRADTRSRERAAALTRLLMNNNMPM